ncbi:MAG TPA: hypothetical protein VFG68_15220 [Fimbriiglobus sp.]|nr:hypothetical protein [Fimbriiglobus sp.]
MNRTSACVVLALLAAGCANKLDTTSSFTLPEGGNATKIFDLPAQSAEETIKVQVTSDKPVDVFVMLAQDAPNLDGLPSKEWQTKSVTFKEGVTSDTLTAKVPAKQATKVVVTPSAKTQKANIKVRLSN